MMGNDRDRRASFQRSVILIASALLVLGLIVCLVVSQFESTDS